MKIVAIFIAVVMIGLTPTAVHIIKTARAIKELENDNDIHDA